MAQSPYIQLCASDYLADTRHLSAEQHGAYLLLIMEAWLRPSCSLPNDDALLSRLCCMTPAQWKKNKPTIMAFWTLDKKRNEWTQKRLKKEHKKTIQKKRKASDSAASRWNKTKKDDANAMRTQCSPSPSPETTNVVSKGARNAPKKRTGFVKPRNAADAAISFIERRGLNDDTRAASTNSEVSSDDVSLLPSVVNQRP